MSEHKPLVTSVSISNKLKKLGFYYPSRYFREWTGAKENEIEASSDGRKYYFVDNVNCYTAKDLGNIIVALIEQGILKP